MLETNIWMGYFRKMPTHHGWKNWETARESINLIPLALASQSPASQVHLAVIRVSIPKLSNTKTRTSFSKSCHNLRAILPISTTCKLQSFDIILIYQNIKPACTCCLFTYSIPSPIGTTPSPSGLAQTWGSSRSTELKANCPGAV